MQAQLEQDLYRAFEISSRAVIAKPKLSDSDGLGWKTGQYDAHQAAAMLIAKVEKLPPKLRALVFLKYAGETQDAELIFQDLQQRFHIPKSAAEVFTLYWLQHPRRPELNSLKPVLRCSQSTVSKKCRKCCLLLDELNLEALELLLKNYIKIISN